MDLPKRKIHFSHSCFFCLAGEVKKNTFSMYVFYKKGKVPDESVIEEGPWGENLFSYLGKTQWSQTEKQIKGKRTAEKTKPKPIPKPKPKTKTENTKRINLKELLGLDEPSRKNSNSATWLREIKDKIKCFPFTFLQRRCELQGTLLRVNISGVAGLWIQTMSNNSKTKSKHLFSKRAFLFSCFTVSSLKRKWRFPVHTGTHTR